MVFLFVLERIIIENYVFSQYYSRSYSNRAEIRKARDYIGSIIYGVDESFRFIDTIFIL